MDSDFFVDGSRHLALQPFDSPTSFSLKKNSLSSVHIKKICIDIKMEHTEGSLPKHNVEKNATNLHN